MPKKAQHHPFPDGRLDHIDWDEDQMSRTLRIRGGGYTVVVYLERVLEGQPGGHVLRENFLRSSRPATDFLPSGGIRSMFIAALDPSFRASWAKVIERPTSRHRARFLRYWRVTIATSRRRSARLRA